MEKKLTFKEYLESKNQLRKKAQDALFVDDERRVTKYCKFPVYSTKDQTTINEISLKPNDIISFEKIIINEQEYIRSVSVNNLKNPPDRSYFPKWSFQKLTSWISKNTTPHQTPSD